MVHLGLECIHGQSAIGVCTWNKGVIMSGWILGECGVRLKFSRSLTVFGVSVYCDH